MYACLFMSVTSYMNVQVIFPWSEVPVFVRLGFFPQPKSSPHPTNTGRCFGLRLHLVIKLYVYHIGVDVSSYRCVIWDYFAWFKERVTHQRLNVAVCERVEEGVCFNATFSTVIWLTGSVSLQQVWYGQKDKDMTREFCSFDSVCVCVLTH